MNTDDLTRAVAAKNNMTLTQTRDVLNSTFDIIQTSVKKGDRVNITGFGVFNRVERKKRTARNPITGDAVKVPAKKVPVFKAGKTFKEAVAKARGTKKK
jgi:DNA-binding protein HU-beta